MESSTKNPTSKIPTKRPRYATMGVKPLQHNSSWPWKKSRGITVLTIVGGFLQIHLVQKKCSSTGIDHPDENRWYLINHHHGSPPGFFDQWFTRRQVKGLPRSLTKQLPFTQRFFGWKDSCRIGQIKTRRFQPPNLLWPEFLHVFIWCFPCFFYCGRNKVLLEPFLFSHVPSQIACQTKVPPREWQHPIKYHSESPQLKSDTKFHLVFRGFQRGEWYGESVESGESESEFRKNKRSL